MLIFFVIKSNLFVILKILNFFYYFRNGSSTGVNVTENHGSTKHGINLKVKLERIESEIKRLNTLFISLNY